jgi:ribonuclease BN (tRNA processing enzyme)
MSDVWSLFIDRINKFNKALIKLFIRLFKNIISKGNLFSKFSLNKIESNKIKWDISKSKEALGDYIYNKHINRITDFSNDTRFEELNKKIKDSSDFLNHKNKN